MGEEKYLIALGVALAVLGAGLCVGAAISLKGLGTLPAAACFLLTLAVTLIWVGATVAAYLAGTTSGPASGLVVSTGLTIPAALIGFLGVVAATVV